MDNTFNTSFDFTWSHTWSGPVGNLCMLAFLARYSYTPSPLGYFLSFLCWQYFPSNICTCTLLPLNILTVGNIFQPPVNFYFPQLFTRICSLISWQYYICTSISPSLSELFPFPHVSFSIYIYIYIYIFTCNILTLIVLASIATFMFWVFEHFWPL